MQTNNSPTSQVNDAVVNKNKRNIFHYLKYAAIGLFLALAICISMLFTAYGQQLAIRLVVKILPDYLAVQQVSGKLSEGLVLDNFSYTSDGIEVQIKHAVLKGELSKLFIADVFISDANLTGTKVIIDIDTLLGEDDDSPSEFSLPVAIMAKNITAVNTYVDIDNNIFNIEDVSTELKLDSKALTIAPSKINNVKLQLDLFSSKQDITQDPDENIAASVINWKAIEQQLQQAEFIDLTYLDLPLAIHLEDIEAKYLSVKTSAEHSFDIANLSLQADLGIKQWEIKNLSLDSSIAKLESQGKIELDGQYPVRLDLILNGKNTEVSDYGLYEVFGKHDIDIKLQGELKDTTQINISAKDLEQPDNILALTSSVQLFRSKIPFNLELNAEQFIYNLPFKQEANPEQYEIIKLNNTKLNLDGNILDYKLALATKIYTGLFPINSITLAGQGNLTSFIIENSDIDALQGNTYLDGNIDWTEGLTWDSKLKFSKLDSKNFFDDWNAKFDGVVENKGFFASNELDIELTHIALKGLINNLDFKLDSKLHLQQPKYAIASDTTLIYGKNNIIAKGILAKNSDMLIKIDAPNLSGMLPNLHGTVFGNIKIDGNILQPNVKANIDAKDFVFNQLSITKLISDIDIVSPDLISGKFNLELHKLKYAALDINQLNANLVGDETAHKLSLNASNDLMSAAILVNGNFNRELNTWEAIVDSSELSSELGILKLNQQVQIKYDHPNTQLDISEHCWQNPNGNLCFTQPIAVGTKTYIQFAANNLNLAILNQIVDARVGVTGVINGSGLITKGQDKLLFAQLYLLSKNINFNYVIDHRAVKVDLHDINVDALLDHDYFTLKSKIKLPSNGEVTAEISVTDLDNQQKVAGKLKLDNINLQQFSSVIGRKEVISGLINSDLEFSGSTTAPLIHGYFNLINFDAEIRALPFIIKQSHVNIKFNGANSTLQAQVATDDGNIDLAGNAKWDKPENWQATVTANTEKLKLTLFKNSSIFINSSLQAIATHNSLDINGDVTIPEGQIVIRSLPPETIKVSDDEVIISSGKQLDNKYVDQILINTDIKLIVEDKLYINAYGLKTNIQGDLNINLEDKKVALYGHLDLKDGFYKAYGQDLIINKGEINFSGNMKHPILNFEAIRNPESMSDENITVGVKVTGIVSKPRLDFFSRPSMPRDRIVAYLLTGNSLENTGDERGSEFNAMLLNVVLSQTSNVVDDIGNALGLKNLSLSSHGSGENMQVAVSGYINSRLQVKYSVGIFDALAKLTLRYRLLPSLYIQAVSGIEQSIDLMYRFEF